MLFGWIARLLTVIIVCCFSLFRFPIFRQLDKWLYGVPKPKKNNLFNSGSFLRFSNASLHAELYHDFMELSHIRVHFASIGLRRNKPLMLFLHGFPEVCLLE